mgnify:FL=1
MKFREEKPSKNWTIAILLMVSLSTGDRESPDDLKDRADNDVVEEDMILGTGLREQTRTFVAESPTAKRLLLEVIRCLAKRVVKETGENDSSRRE